MKVLARRNKPEAVVLKVDARQVVKHHIRWLGIGSLLARDALPK
jgi:hypothetical protein